ncbi:MAG: LA_2272 family surface repeat-containing protein [Gemmatimonadales bacterium]
MSTGLARARAVLALLAGPAPALAQQPEAADPAPATHRALNLTIQGFGLSIGNSARVNGLRINFQDHRLERVNGVNLTFWTDLTGFSFGAYNRVQGTQVGLAIGIYNSARTLKGLQIGLLNRADNNKPPFRYLPILNAHFD